MILRYLMTLIIVWVSLSVTTVFADKTAEIGVADWPPLISQDLLYNGVIARVVEDSFALSGVEVSFKWASWKRAFTNVSNKIWDASPGWTKTEERMSQVLYSDLPIFEKYQVFFHLKSYKFDWNEFEDLKQLKIGATRGYFYGNEFQKALGVGKIDVEYVAEDYQNLRKMLLGRIHIFPLNILTGYDLIKSNLSASEAAMFTHHPKKLSLPSGSYMVFSKTEKGQQLLAKFNEGFKELKQSGKYDQYFREFQKGHYKK